jgi:hypothetical protein
LITVEVENLFPAHLIAALSDGQIETLLDNLAAAARAKWIGEAQGKLHGTAQDYIRGLQEVVSERGQRTITLLGWLPNALEQGMDSFDMGPGLLSGKSAHISADGSRYAHIPFRHGSAGSLGQAGKPMGERMGPQGSMSRARMAEGMMGATDAKALGRMIYDAAKKLKGKQALPAGMTSALAPWHKTDIYAGMQRVRKPYTNEATGKTTMQSQYQTFRTISDNGTPWIHPGLEPRRFADAAAAHVERIASAAIMQLIKGAG